MKSFTILLSLCLVLVPSLQVKLLENALKPEKKDIESVLNNLKGIYSDITETMTLSESQILEELTVDFFKAAEQTIKTAYYEAVHEKDVKILIPKLITLVGLKSGEHETVSHLIENQMMQHPDYFSASQWMNFNFMDSKANEEETVVFGNMYVTRKEDPETKAIKYYIYLIYGKAHFEGQYYYSEQSLKLVGEPGKEEFATVECFAYDFPDDEDEDNYYRFFALVGFKALAKEYSMVLPYPVFE